MKTSEFIDRLCVFARESIAAKCTNPMTQMVIGAATCGVGRKILEAKAVPMLELCAGSDGNLDLSGLYESVSSGLSLAKSVPLLGGAISIDAQDAEEFFEYLRK